MSSNTVNADMSNANKLMSQVAIGDVNPITKGSWLSNPDKINKVKLLKELALGNCRLLYGSERFKFYDIVVCEDERNELFAALLTCNQEQSTKILQREVNACPVEAVRKMVERLQRDTTKLFTKYAVGSQIRGQQGNRNFETGTFGLWEGPQDERNGGPDDDTSGMAKKVWDFRDDIPRGPRADRRSNKRPYKERLEDEPRRTAYEDRRRTSFEEGELRENGDEWLPY